MTPPRLTVFEIMAIILFVIALVAFGVMDAEHFHCTRANATATMHCGTF
jgi:hypothetical protein